MSLVSSFNLLGLHFKQIFLPRRFAADKFLLKSAESTWFFLSGKPPGNHLKTPENDQENTWKPPENHQKNIPSREPSRPPLCPPPTHLSSARPFFCCAKSVASAGGQPKPRRLQKTELVTCFAQRSSPERVVLSCFSF